MPDKYPSALPTLPLRRFYIRDEAILDVEGEAWVEAENAVAAAHMARLLYASLFTGFSHEAYIDPQTGKASRYDYTLDGAFDMLGRVLEEREGRA